MIEIDREHPEYKRQRQVLSSYRDLYAGGQEFKDKAGLYLLRRQKEPADVYGERLQRVFYENYIGSIIDWYAATLFRREPSFTYESGLESGKKFLGQFFENCDLRGSRLSEFFRECLIEALIVGRVHLLVDFPRVSITPTNRAEEDAAGLSRAYLVRFQSEELINWSTDEHGQYEWVVL